MYQENSLAYQVGIEGFLDYWLELKLYLALIVTEGNLL